MWHSLITLSLIALLCGCSTPPQRPAPSSAHAIPPLRGSYHVVRRGETLWRIAHAYGVDVTTLVNANRLPSHQIDVGQRLFVPLPRESSQFLWPARGLTKASIVAGGIDIAAPAGSVVRASRSGQVAVATMHLSGWGKTVILDHGDGYLSVYAGLDQLFVAAGDALQQGMPLGGLGTRSLHFEIRYHTSVRHTLALLPSE